MPTEISDTQFVKEMRILWQNSSIVREELTIMIRDYSDTVARAEKIIFKLQS